MAPGISRKTRRLFFYTLILVFVLIAPLLVALSYGYRLDMVTGEVEQRGGIFVKSQTPSLSIFLNGNFVKETSFFSGGALLPEVTPGTYLLRIEKEGYYPWSKTVEVKPALVTELRHIILTPRALAPALTIKTDQTLVESQNIADKNFSLDRKNNLIQKTATSSRILANNVNTFGVIDDTIFFIDKNGFLARLALANGAVETIARLGFFLKEEPGVKFMRSPAGDLAVLDDAGGLFIFNSSGSAILIGKGVLGMSFDERGDKILIAKESEVEVFWLRPNSYQPFQPAGTKEKIWEAKNQILDARWFYGDDYHVVIQTPEEIMFAEIDGRGGRNSTELVSEKTDKIATVAEQPTKVFYKKGKVWYTLGL